jgi:protein O-mannosyl-transferase
MTMKKNKKKKQVLQQKIMHKEPRFRMVLFCITIVVVTVVVFLPSLNNHFTNWDDNEYVTENADLQLPAPQYLQKIFTSSYSSNYHPLTMMMYWTEHHFFKFNPVPYHIVNLMLHSITVVLFCILLYLLTGSSIAGFIGALLFAVHPLRVESVVWIAELKDVLSGMLYLAALITWLRFIKHKKKTMYAATLVLCLLALLAKPMAVSLPAILLLLDYYMKRPFRSAVILEKIPFVIIAAADVVATIIAQHGAGAIQLYPSLPFVYRLCVPFYALMFYIVKTIIPIQLCALYSFPTHPEGIMALQMLAAPFVVAIIAVVLFRIRAWNRYTITAVVFYVITLLPVLQILPVGAAIVSERYTYLPMLGLTGLAAVGIALLLKHKLSGNKPGRAVVWACFIVIVVVLGITSYERSLVWESTETLWTDTIKKSHDSIAYYNLGCYYANSVGQFYPAIDNLTEAIKRNPNFLDAFNNRGIAYMGIKCYDLAIADFSNSLKKDPDNILMLNNRATAYLRIGKTDSAFANYNEALRLAPNYAEIYMFRGIAYADGGNYTKAIEDFTRAIAIKPDLLEAYGYRASCNYELHRYADALADVKTIQQQGVISNPDFVKELYRRVNGN